MEEVGLYWKMLALFRIVPKVWRLLIYSYFYTPVITLDKCNQNLESSYF